MAARVIWKGHISFGLVEIPVGLYTATRSDDLSFDLLDKRDKAPIGYRKINKRTGEEVSPKEIVRAYEIEDGQYVVLDDDDFARANVRATKTIDIVAFVDASEIDPQYYDRPYYLAPTRKGSKAYALLREALRRTNKVGIARVVLRSRQYLAAVLPYGNTIVLDVLRYGYELRKPEELDVPGEDLDELGVRDKEIELAERLVEELAGDFDPNEYKDEYREDLLALIHEKAEKGDKAIVARGTEEEEPAGEVVDIMTLLKRSVEKAGTGKQAPARARKPATKAPAHEDKGDEEKAPARASRSRKAR